MELNEFHRYLLDNHPMHAAWGDVVSSEIQKAVMAATDRKHLKGFLKVPVEPRVKDIKSAIGKVARKGYENPVIQMTDLVGTRFVVLLSSDIDIVCSALESISEFSSVVSKDYLSDIETNPKIFDYQSKHYEVRPKEEFTVNNITITTEACCEVQIRTLLQHAYAELVHDNIYKPVGVVPKAAERHIARSMALMETTDDLFCSTMELLYETNKGRNEFLFSLVELYKACIGEEHVHLDDATNFHILDEYKNFINEETFNKVEELIKKKKFLPSRIRNRSSENSLFGQPSVLFLYHLVSTLDSDQITKLWPLPGYLKDLNLVFSDLGVNTSL